MEAFSQDNIRLFQENAKDYDEWFDRHPAVYQSELAALRELTPASGNGVEIGAGTGRFAQPLGIKLGVEPAAEMGALAEGRGVRIQRALAEDLPFGDGQFDFALLVTVLCFVRDPVRALSEIRRILKPGGLVLVGFVDRESRAGRQILSSGSKYYRDASLYSARDTMELLTRAGFQLKDSRQTLFENPQTLAHPEQPKPGFGEGDFIVFAAQKPA